MFQGFRESLGGKRLVICDVQPEYANNIHFMDRWAEFLNSYGDILVLFNGPDLGFGGKANIARWYRQNGVPRAKLLGMKWHEKNYAWFRDPMDSCWARDSIIRIVRYMLRKRVYDIRQLSADDVRRINVSELEFEKLEDHFLGIPELYRILPRWNGADICGGGRHECLDEVMILTEALKLQFNSVEEFIY